MCYRYTNPLCLSTFYYTHFSPFVNLFFCFFEVFSLPCRRNRRLRKFQLRLVVLPAPLCYTDPIKQEVIP